MQSNDRALPTHVGDGSREGHRVWPAARVRGSARGARALRAHPSLVMRHARRGSAHVLPALGPFPGPHRASTTTTACSTSASHLPSRVRQEAWQGAISVSPLLPWRSPKVDGEFRVRCGFRAGSCRAPFRATRTGLAIQSIKYPVSLRLRTLRTPVDETRKRWPLANAASKKPAFSSPSTRAAYRFTIVP